MKKIKNFLNEVRKEMTKVHFPTKKEMTLYSVATVAFIVFFSMFFMLSDIIIVILKRLVG